MFFHNYSMSFFSESNRIQTSRNFHYYKQKKRSDLFQRFRIIRTPSDFPKTDASGLNDFKFKKYYASSIAFPISWRMYLLAKFTHSVAS